MRLGLDLEERRQVAADIKRNETQEEERPPVQLQLVLPDGSSATLRLARCCSNALALCSQRHQCCVACTPLLCSTPAGVTVAYLKLLIEQQHGVPQSEQDLKVAGRAMMDPFSLCDIPGLQPGCTATVEVKQK